MADPKPPVWPTWPEIIADLNNLDHAFGPHLGDLLSKVMSRWQSKVVVTRCLLFYPPGMGIRLTTNMDRPGASSVYVSWADDIFEVRLTSDEGLLVTADRCGTEASPLVLESFLMQLPGGP